MILIFFLCLKLSILHLCVSDPGYECYTEPEVDSRKNKIYLVNDNNGDAASVLREKFNDAFTRYCQVYYEIDIGPLNQTSETDNIVHFAVPDYYDGKPLNDYVYAGNVSKNDNAACTMKTYHNEKPVKDCNEIANLVRKSVFEMNDGHLYDFIQAMDYKNEKYVGFTSATPTSCEPLRHTSDLNVVILCLPELSSPDRIVRLKNLKLIQMSKHLCSRYLKCREMYYSDEQYFWMTRDLRIGPEPQELIQPLLWDFIVDICAMWDYKYKNRLLAMLAPEPLRDTLPFNISDSLIPTIFYETPYMYSETKTDYPNSMNLVPWRLLKFGFLKFIQKVGWRRVAIVSDDSDYSVAFEDELTALFRKEKGMTHAVIRCEDANCDMDKIARQLNEAASWIIIANVEAKNARMLMKNTDARFTWLLRDMTGNIVANRVAFSFSLHIDTKTKDCNDVDKNILTGLDGIAQAYENTKKYTSKLKKNDFYRLFAKELQRVTPRTTEAEIVIERITMQEYNKYEYTVISRMSVNANGVINTVHDMEPFPEGRKPKDGTNCLVSTYDYYKPCEDPLVLLFMFTLMLFVLTILLITCYFDKTSPFNDVRYQNF